MSRKGEKKRTEYWIGICQCQRRRVNVSVVPTNVHIRVLGRYNNIDHRLISSQGKGKKGQNTGSVFVSVKVDE